MALTDHDEYEGSFELGNTKDFIEVENLKIGKTVIEGTGSQSKPVQRTSAEIQPSSECTQEFKHIVSQSGISSVVAVKENNRSAVKSLHSIASDENSVKSSLDHICSDENVFNAEFPEDALIETQTTNQTEISALESITESEIKDLHKEKTENVPQEKEASTGDDGTQNTNQTEITALESKTESEIKNLHNERKENVPQEKEASTGDDGTQTTNHTEITALESKKESEMKDLHKDRTENVPQEKEASSGYDGNSMDPVNKFASDEKKELETFRMKMLKFILIPSISKALFGLSYWIFCVMLFVTVCKCTEMPLERDKVNVFLVNANSIRVIVNTNETNDTTKWMKTTDGKSDPLVFQNKVNPKFIGKVQWENYTSILINDLTNEEWNSYLSFIKGFDSIQTKKLKEYVEPLCPNSFSVVESSGTNVTVMWYSGLNRGHQLVVYLQYKINESSDWLLAYNMSEQYKQKKNFTIADLKSETLYNLRLLIVDMNDNSCICKNLTANTKNAKLAPHWMESDNKELIAIVMIVLGCVFLILAFGILILYGYQIYHKHHYKKVNISKRKLVPAKKMPTEQEMAERV